MYKFIQAILLLVCFSFATNTQAQIINIPDTAFKTILLQADISNQIALGNSGNIKIDANNNGEIERSEVVGITYLNVTGIGFNTNIRLLSGIEYFVNLLTLECSNNKIDSLDLRSLSHLQTLNCNQNNISKIDLRGLINLELILAESNKLTSIDVNDLSNLTILRIGGNQLTDLNINGLNNLAGITCYQNQLTKLNIDNLPNLALLDCSDCTLETLDLSEFQNLVELECVANKLISLNLTNLTKLKKLRCDFNKLSSLDLRGLIDLEEVNCTLNQLENLFVSGLPKLISINCSDNKLTTINISGNRNLTYFYANQNRLKSLYLKNDTVNTTINYAYSYMNNPNIKYLCLDQGEIDIFYNGYNNSGIIINSLCSSVSNGSFYFLNATCKIDIQNSGCDTLDPIYPNLKIKIKNATDSGYVFADSNGNFATALDSGTYTITPQLPNSYFICTPTSTFITFPEDTIPQQFCITPNGTHHDVSVTVIPIRAARPGFSDATYKIVLKNKGNLIENGTILFRYDENKQDYISATTTPNSITSGELTFAFSNLIPFETREITVTMRTNAPTDNPAVNAGDVLNVQVATTLDNGVRDEYIKDNFLNIKQTVVGSIDPNDKTCLEGKIATPDIIGDFVNYLIRFENTGTANAENVVVTDFIDLAKFDISTLELTSTSHSCKTVISNGNKVQFVFDNINLPYTDPKKYGYVAFKIKTKSNLVIGDSLKNTADIYFDYNLPIKTNTAATRIDNIILSTKNATNKEGSLSVYPNPSTGNFIINFESKGNFPITLKMMDLKGSVVLEKNINHTEKSTLNIDDKNISNGIYLINIHSEKENWLQKLMIVK